MHHGRLRDFKNVSTSENAYQTFESSRTYSVPTYVNSISEPTVRSLKPGAFTCESSVNTVRSIRSRGVSGSGFEDYEPSLDAPTHVNEHSRTVISLTGDHVNNHAFQTSAEIDRARWHQHRTHSNSRQDRHRQRSFSHDVVAYPSIVPTQIPTTSNLQPFGPEFRRLRTSSMPEFELKAHSFHENNTMPRPPTVDENGVSAPSANGDSDQSLPAYLRAPPDLMAFDPNRSPSAETMKSRVNSFKNLNSRHSSLTTLSRLSDSPRVSTPTTPRVISPPSSSLSHVRFSTPVRLSEVPLGTGTAANAPNSTNTSPNESSVSVSNSSTSTATRWVSCESMRSLDPTPRMDDMDPVFGLSLSWSKRDSSAPPGLSPWDSSSRSFSQSQPGVAIPPSQRFEKCESEFCEEDLSDRD